MTIIYFLRTWGIITSFYTMLYEWEIIQHLVCIFLFNWHLPKRKYTWLYCTIGTVLMLGWGFLLGFLRDLWPDSNLFKIFATLSLYSFSLFITFFCYNEKHWSHVFLSWITALCVREVIEDGFSFQSILKLCPPREVAHTNYNFFFPLTFFHFIFPKEVINFLLKSKPYDLVYKH